MEKMVDRVRKNNAFGVIRQQIYCDRPCWIFF